MSPPEAAKILDLPADATAEQIETRFNELRARLEDKIVKAPTPGLKAKYRESLDEITTAFETLNLAADASALPVLNKPAAARVQPPAPATGGGPPSAAKKSGGREFAIVLTLALVVLAGGGWFVLKTRAARAEEARLVAEQKAETQRQATAAKMKEEAELARIATAEKAERERQERLLAQTRGRVAELNVTFDATMRVEQTAERDLNEMKAQERDLGRSPGGPNLESLRLAAQLKAQGAYLRWVRETLPDHPVRMAKARAEELLAARVLPESTEAVEAYATELAQLKSALAAHRPDLAAIAAAQQLPPAPVVAKIRPDGFQTSLAYLADRLYPYDEPTLVEVRNKILHDDLRVVLFPQLEPYRSNLSKLWSDVEVQLQTLAGQEAQLRTRVSTQFPNSASLLRAIDGNQALDPSLLKDPVIKALILVRWQMLNIREQVHQSRFYFGLNPN